MMRNTAAIQVNLDLGAADGHRSALAARARPRPRVDRVVRELTVRHIRGTDRIPFDPRRSLGGDRPHADESGTRYRPNPARAAWTRYVLDAPIMMIQIDDADSVAQHELMTLEEWIVRWSPARLADDRRRGLPPHDVVPAGTSTRLARTADDRRPSRRMVAGRSRGHQCAARRPHRGIPGATRSPSRCTTVGEPPHATPSAIVVSAPRRPPASMPRSKRRPRLGADDADARGDPRVPRSLRRSSSVPGRRPARRVVTTPGRPRLNVVSKTEIVASLEEARRRTLGVLAPIPDAEQRVQVSELMSPLCWDLAHIGHFEELWLVRELTGAPPTAELHDDVYDAFKHSAPRPTLVADPRSGRRAEVRRRHPHARARRARSHRARPRRPPARRWLRLRDGCATRASARRDPARDHPAHGRLRASRRRRATRLRATVGDDRLERRRRRRCSRRHVHDGDRHHTVGVRQRATGPRRDVWAHSASTRSPSPTAAYLEFVGERRVRRTDPLDRRRMAMADRSASSSAPEFWSSNRRRHLDAPAVRSRSRSCRGTSRSSTCAGTRPTRTRAGRARASHRSRVGVRRARIVVAPTPTSGARAPRRFGAVAGRIPRRQRRATSASTACSATCGSGPRPISSRIPGSEPFPYPEYSEVFFGPEYKVLRGGSWATHPSAVRTTFRNWDYPIRRQIFAGFRCVRDA